MRYLRLYLHFLRFSISRALEFRLDFLFRVGMDTVFYLVTLAFFRTLYAHTESLGGWSLDQIDVFVCGYLWVDALYMTIFSNNVWWLPIAINRGDLDYHLTRPVSSLFFLSLREFAVSSFVNLLMAGGLVVWSLVKYPAPLSAGQVLAFSAFLCLGTYLLYCVRVLFVIPVFWLHSGHGLLEISWSLTHLGERPVQIYRGWLRLALYTLIPMAFIATVPSAVLFDGLSLKALLQAVLVTAAFSGALGWAWKRGLAAYASASS